MSNRYNESNRLLKRALHSIPLGTQTFSKSHLNFPQESAPLFLTHGKGCKVWDVDGNEYLDFLNGLAAIMLGYQDPDVNAAVSRQLQDGVLFSLAHPLEMQVAELIVDMVPCAEMVRFGKNGSDATAAAVRLARAYTGRDHVAVCGYHGWQDWYIGSTARDLGVPEFTKSLTHAFSYNDIESLENLFAEFPHKIAGVILEPMNSVFPQDGFLQKVQALTAREGAVLIFDEIVTGFRLAKGGAQEYFDVTPDLACVGKGMANGFPLSAVVGRKEIMQLLDQVFFSFTAGGEALSLAAAQAVLMKIQAEPVLERIHAFGADLIAQVNCLIKEYNLTELLTLSGHPAWSIFTFSAGLDVELYKMYFKQEMMKRGILISMSHNVSYANAQSDLACLINIYREVLPLLHDALVLGDMKQRLLVAESTPIFQVR